MPGTLDRELEERLLALQGAPATLEKFHRRLADRGILFGGAPLPTFLRPHILPASAAKRWIADTEALFALVERLVDRVIDDTALASWLGFSGYPLELFRINPGYRRSVVIARPDALERGDGIRFVEINTDSPAMMTMADEIQSALLELPPLCDLRERLALESRVPALLEALLDVYREYGGRGAPSIAIVDWPSEKTVHEQKRTAEIFTQLGCPTRFAPPDTLRYDGRALSADGVKVDFVYRRVLFRDFVAKRPELDPLLAAYRDGRVCMANPLRSYVSGTKAMLALLHDPTNPASLTAQERALVDRVVPRTRWATPHSSLGRQDWVLKKAESHGGNDVVLGPFVDDERWAGALAAVGERTWVCQEAEAVPRYKVPVCAGDRFELVEKFGNWNPFVFGGRHGGGITRVSESFLISITRGGGLLPAIRATEG